MNVEGLLDWKCLGTWCLMWIECMDCMMGFGGSNTSSGKRIIYSTNDADRHWRPHVILVNLYGRELGRSVKLTDWLHILTGITISGFVPPLPFHNVRILTETESFLPDIHCESSNPKIPQFGVGERPAVWVVALQHSLIVCECEWHHPWGHCE
jgi:hypothetical protein